VTDEDARLLLAVAEQSIRHGLHNGRALSVNLSDYPESLHQPGACFVTLRKHGELRGCIGSLNPRRPLLEDIAQNSFAAAFQDPRFAPLHEDELAELKLHISLLGPAEPLAIASEDELLAKLRPGIDGLILEDGPYRATFLPSVWEQLPEPRQFLRQLKRKAGLADDYWSKTLRFSRYQCEGIE
jgi:AmmeMemoRadiSam system protein A